MLCERSANWLVRMKDEQLMFDSGGQSSVKAAPGRECAVVNLEFKKVC
ncbi:hypothetical protein ACMD2_27146, partial [Ananas comosus]